jgi:hypothetical protein
MSNFDILFEILDNRAEQDFYREQAETNALLDSELLPEVEFEPYDSEGVTVWKNA